MPDDHPAVPPRLGYQPALDGVRALSVIGVIASHAFVPHLYGGRIGVFVFFTLSGFLITRLLLDEQAVTGRVNLPSFYARRALRLFPALVVVVVATSVYAVIRPHQYGVSATLGSIGPALFYYANWVIYAHAQHSMGLFNHFWSLSVEEQFYLVWPAVLIACRRRRDLLTAALFVIVVVGLGCRLHSWHGVAATHDHLLEGTQDVADLLAFGGLLAIASLAAPNMTARVCRVGFWPAVAFLAYVVAHLDLRDIVHTSIALPLETSGIGLAGALIIGHLTSAADSLEAKVLGWRPLAYLGRISYGMYLWHVLMVELILFDGGWLGQTRGYLAVYAATFAVASASYFGIERPFLRRKRVLEPASTAPDPALAQ